MRVLERDEMAVAVGTSVRSTSPATTVGDFSDDSGKRSREFSFLSLQQSAEFTSLKENERLGYLMAKRTLDIAGASFALIFLSPVFLLVAALIWLEDGGSIFYKHNRVGRGGREFSFYKFRSMVPNADAVKAKLMDQNEARGPIFKMRNDPRVTRIGRILRRCSLDELPQFWNVLRGDMSLVGPRPHLPSEVSRYRPEQRARFSVQPGLICLREVHGRSHLSFDRWVEMDLEYIRDRSFVLDIYILCCAVPAILKGDGAY